MAEARISINGVELSEGQAMTLRVALQSFASETQEENSLGNDKYGQKLAAAYNARANEVIELLFAN